MGSTCLLSEEQAVCHSLKIITCLRPANQVIQSFAMEGRRGPKKAGHKDKMKGERVLAAPLFLSLVSYSIYTLVAACLISSCARDIYLRSPLRAPRSSPELDLYLSPAGKARVCCGKSSSTGRARTRPLNRILEGCQNVKRARFGLPVSKMRGGTLFLKRVRRLYEYKNTEGKCAR